MNPVIVQELEHNKSRLSFYAQAKEKTGSKKNPVLDKWITIYAERVQKLEKQLNKVLKQQAQPGLRMAVAAAPAARKAKRSRTH